MPIEKATLTVIYVMLGMMAGDFVTGNLKHILEGDWSSKLCKQGLIKKALYFFLVAAGFGLGILMGQIDTVVKGVCLCLCVVEVGSMIENLKECGLPIPKVITEIIDKLKQENPVGEHEATEEE